MEYRTGLHLDGSRCGRIMHDSRIIIFHIESRIAGMLTVRTTAPEFPRRENSRVDETPLTIGRLAGSPGDRPSRPSQAPPHSDSVRKR